MLDSVQRLQLVHSATSIIMFHFFIRLLQIAAAHAQASIYPPVVPRKRGTITRFASVDRPALPHLREHGVWVPAFAGTTADVSGFRITHFAGTRCAAFSESRTSSSLSISAYVSDICSVRRSHSSTCTSELAPASEWVDLVCVRSGVSRLRQPPRSTDLPGSPIGS